MFNFFSKKILFSGCFFLLIGCNPSEIVSNQNATEIHPEPTTTNFTATIPAKLSDRQLKITVDKCFYFDFNPNPNGISLKYPLASFSDSNQVRFECLKDKEAYTQLDIDAIPERKMILPQYDHFQDKKTNLNYMIRYELNTGGELLEKNNQYVLYKIGHKMMLAVFEDANPFLVIFTPDRGENTGYFDDQYELITVLDNDFSITYQIYGLNILENLPNPNARISNDMNIKFQDYFIRNKRDIISFSEAINDFSKINQQVVAYFLGKSDITNR